MSWLRLADFAARVWYERHARERCRAGGRASSVGKREEQRRERAAKATHHRPEGERRTRGTQRPLRSVRPALTAATADKHDLYQRSVQNPDEEAKFVAKTFRALRGRAAADLREDFCGTAAFCASWVRLAPTRHRATGLDVDREVLDWGRAHNVLGLGELAERVTLVEQDVRQPTPPEFDVVTAFNFSYWLFKTRPELRAYFESVRASLRSDGVFFLDAYGGWEAHEPMQEARTVEGGFTYVWDQSVVNPIDNGLVNHIHFRFKDGTALERAFTYDWRHWSLPEIRELLLEAGFSSATVYWDVAAEGDDEDYRPRTRADNQPGWLAYLVACR
jgi:SAM-dependent methyltransferase